MNRIAFLVSLLFSLISCNNPKSDDSVFGDAEWIGTSQSVLYSDFLPQFTLSCRISMGQAAERASVIVGANDPRLMDSNLNIMGVENAKDESYVRIELDSGNRCVNVYRTGYTLSDTYGKVLKSLPFKDEIKDEESHALRADVAYSRIKIFVDGVNLGQVDAGPLGNGGDYIAYPQMAQVGYLVERGQSATFNDFMIRELREPNAVLFMDTQSRTIRGEKMLFDPDFGGMPVLRSVLKVKDKEIETASIVSTARGVYNISINGQKVGTGEYAPGLSQYNKHHYYQSYDVKDLLSSGDNLIMVNLAEGWWSGDLTYDSGNRNYFGDQLAFKACIRVEYSDGTSTVLCTDPENWEVTTEGPVVYASMFQGQVVDARKTLENASWTKAEIMSLVGHTSPETFGATAPRVDDYDDFQMVRQTDSEPSVFQTLQAVSVNEVRPGVFVYDMGQNFAGIPSILFNGLKPGQQVRMRYAEILYPKENGKTVSNTGMVMLENIRGAMAQDIYIASSDRNQLFEPHMTLHGYRYVEITGIDKALPLSAVKGLVISSVQKFTAHYECSNPDVNRLWKNIQWSMLSNFISIPTDCPQRNERMGWSGDLSVFSRTATYLADVDEFLRRHTQAIRDVQMPDGRMPDVAPVGGAFGGLLWGSAGITVPYECYRQYADTKILEDNYEAMCAYIDYIQANYINKDNNLFFQGGRGFMGGLGDWLGPQNGQIDNSALWDAYYIFDLQIMTEVAGVLGHNTDAKRFSEDLAARKEFWVKTYIEPEKGRFVASEYVRNGEGSILDFQSSYVLPLAFGIIDDPDLRKKVAKSLLSTLQYASYSDNGVYCPPYSLMTGFITTAWISKALSDNGYSEAAYRLLQQTSYPSWLYPVQQGATTIWERLDSYTKERGFGGNNSMNSFNHYSFGAVGQWLMAYSLGIDRDPVNPGFKHFVLHPEVDPTAQMTYARGWYDSPYGRIESSWEINKDGTVSYRFVIPQGTSATLKLPERPDEELGPGEYIR